MSCQEYRFSFTLFGKKVQRFESGDAGVVIQKGAGAIFVYGTDAGHTRIFCSVPICRRRLLMGKEFTVSFPKPGLAAVRAGVVRIVIDFAGKCCANNMGLRNYGSDEWGQSVSVLWDSDKDRLFCGE